MCFTFTSQEKAESGLVGIPLIPRVLEFSTTMTEQIIGMDKNWEIT
jgi:hypothetical protein